MNDPELDFTITPVQATELQELADLAARTWAAIYGPYMSSKDLHQSLVATKSVVYFRNLKDGRVLVAKHRGRIVGYIQFGKVEIDAPTAGKEDKELSRFYVDETMRGHGIGRRLLAKVLDDPILKHAPTIFLKVWEENRVAVKLYREYGFEQAGVRELSLLNFGLSHDLILARHQPI